MFARGRGRSGDGGSGRGFGFGNMGPTSAANNAANPFAGVAQRFALGNSVFPGSLGSLGASANPFGSFGLGVNMPIMGAATTSATTNASGAQNSDPARPKVALVGTTASAMSAWWSLYETGYDVVIVAGGPDAAVDELDAREEAKLESAAKDFVKGCIQAFNVPRELTEEERKAKAAAKAPATTPSGPPALGVGTWSFLGNSGAGLGGSPGMSRLSAPGTSAAPASTAPAAAVVPEEDPLLRGVRVCAWSQLMVSPTFDEVDVVYVTARAFPSPEKTPAVAAPTSARGTTSPSSGYNSRGRGLGATRAHATGISSTTGSSTPTLTNPNDGLEAFVLHCVERGKHVVLDTPPAANAGAVTGYVEAMTAAQKPKVCVMDRTAGIWGNTSWFDALRKLSGIPVIGAGGGSDSSGGAVTSSPTRFGRTSSGRRTLSSGRLRGRGGGGVGGGVSPARGATSSSAAAVTAAASEATAKYTSQVGVACHTRLHVCVPCAMEAGPATAAEPSSSVSRVKKLSEAQPTQQLTTCHPLLFRLPPPPPTPRTNTTTTATATATTASGAGAGRSPGSDSLPHSVSSTPMNSGRRTTSSLTPPATTSVTPDPITSSAAAVPEDNTPLGVLGDIGYHVIAFYLALFDWSMPSGIMATVLTRDAVSGAPTSVEGTLYFRFPSPAEEEAEEQAAAAASARRGTSLSRRGSLTGSGRLGRGPGTSGSGGASDTPPPAQAETPMSEAERLRRHAPRIVPARFYIANDPRAPLSQRLTVNGTKGTLDVPAPLFPLQADRVAPAKAEDGAGAAATTPADGPQPPKPTTGRADRASSSSSSTTITTLPALPTASKDPAPPPPPPQTTTRYTVCEYGSAAAGSLQLRCRTRTTEEGTLPATLHPDVQLWMLLKQALGLESVAGASAPEAAPAGRRGSLGGGVGSTSSPSSSYLRNRRAGSSLHHNSDPGRFPVQDVDTTTKLIRSMWMTQQVLDALRRATSVAP